MRYIYNQTPKALKVKYEQVIKSILVYYEKSDILWMGQIQTEWIETKKNFCKMYKFFNIKI
jgi:hypothetical protein